MSRNSIRRWCRRRNPADESGQAMAEFALILPVLCLVLFGILQFGLMFFNYIDLTSAVREGARKASVLREDANGVAEAEAAIANATAVVNDDDVDISIDSQPWTQGQDIEIEAEYPYTLSIMGVEIWDGPMTAKAVVRVE
jgi:Flp pilus assembly protein TadG